MSDDTTRLAALFNGLDRAHGVSVPTGRKDARGKVGAKYETRRAAVTADDWQKHLAGDHCLVLIPIRDDATTGFGVIDVDVYPLDLTALVARVEELGLPLVVCRSKSGGAHLFLFLVEPYDAEHVQERLMGWSAALGYPGVEVFPKQTSLASERDTGNGIAAPYRNAENTLEYALAPDGGHALELAEFLDLAEARREDGGTLPEVTVDVPDDLEEAPPCLQAWAREGVGEGQRNDVMFDFALYARRRWPDSWREKFEELNHKYSKPPLPAAEVLAIIKSVSGLKEYMYKSKCQGPYCNPQICRKREHGRGGGYDDSNVVVDGLTIIETVPPTYIVAVNGKRIELSGPEWRDQRAFGGRVEDSLFIVYKQLKPKRWQDLRERLIASAEFEDAPEDASARGQLLQQLEDFFDEHLADEREKLRLEHCWFDADHGKVYFRSRDFMHFLKRRRVYGVKEKDMFTAIRSIGGGADQLRVGHGPIRVWWVPREPPALPEPLPVPAAATKTEDDDVPF